MKTTRAKQHDENLRRLADRKHHNAYKGLLLGEEILKLRHRYGLTRKAAARIFGKSNSTFARYEHELSYPNESMTMLLRMSIEKPETLQWLAAQVNENIPLWTERYEDQSKV
jgi:HTH-type transcriptional regulator/antitoxin MqsA